MNKKGASFGEIMGVFGAILIAIGFAWLIAQNWHIMPSALKIFVLLVLTLGAYIGGVILKEKEYDKTAKALFVLGALLFTLSVFLIAQIFSIAEGLQYNSWLLLICLVGVTFSAYMFSSYTTLIIAMIEFIVWVNFQFTAFTEKGLFNYGGERIMLVIYVFLMLAVGIFFYGLNLLHRSKEHEFANLYRWLTLFYFLSFFYWVSFQYFLPILWEGNFVFLANYMIFVYVFAVIGIATTIIGAFMSNKEEGFEKEILAFFIIVVVLIGLVMSTSIGHISFLPQAQEGDCYIKNCNNLDRDSCENNNIQGLNSEWRTKGGNYCTEFNCNKLAKEECTKNSICQWKDDWKSCSTLSCWSFSSKDLCNNAPAKMNCEWNVGSNLPSANYPCSLATKNKCAVYNNQMDKCTAQEECLWRKKVNDTSYFSHGYVSLSDWIVWIVINLAFIGFILLVIGYGTLLKSRAIINLGIVFFSLDIITRYIGFLIDFWGYIGLSVTFIIGGGILIVGGFLIERWRRNLIKKAE